VVTLDLEMPVMDGMEVLRVLRRTRPDLPVVVFSTLTERGGTATLDALAAGASDYVTKPTSVRNLEEAVRAVRDQLAPKVISLHEARLAKQGRTPRRVGDLTGVLPLSHAAAPSAPAASRSSPSAPPPAGRRRWPR
jgi:two-component system chemotaxis response regulator CheB